MAARSPTTAASARGSSCQGFTRLSVVVIVLIESHDRNRVDWREVSIPDHGAPEAQLAQLQAADELQIGQRSAIDQMKDLQRAQLPDHFANVLDLSARLDSKLPQSRRPLESLDARERTEMVQLGLLQVAEAVDAGKVRRVSLIDFQLREHRQARPFAHRQPFVEPA